MEKPSDDRLVAGAARFLLDDGQEDAVHVLLSCAIELQHIGDNWGDYFVVLATGPRAAYEVLSKDGNPIRQAIIDAFTAVSPWDEYCKSIAARIALTPVSPNWREELFSVTTGEHIHNQGIDVGSKQAIIWSNLRFRSVSEQRIAAELDEMGVLYLPNCMSRLGVVGSPRVNREPDFLVCNEGKWGILEVDGERFHPPSRKVHEDERDRLFKQHGVRVVEHFDASRCYESPRAVVREFLAILKQS